LKLNNALSVGYFGQSNIDNLAKEKTILEALHVDKSKTEQEIRNIAGSLLFSGSLAKKKISVLSGGEKARVNLGRVLLQTTNLLLLDEPTNHLDYESVEALIEAIKKYSGAVVVVAHDENFLQQVATKLVIFDNDEVFVWNGNYQDFIDKKGFSIEQKEEVDLENFPGKKSAELNYEERKTWQKLLRKAEKDLKKTEKQITELEDRQLENKEKVHVFLRQGNRTMLEKLGIESEKIQDELGAKLGKWEKLGEEIEFLHLGLD
jgi:ATP-binding cassette subfamily F protein 3